MINNSQDIEKLVKQTFSKFEADVPPDTWINIQESMLNMPSSSPAGSSGASKTAEFFSKSNSVIIISSTVALVSMIAGIFYFSTDKKAENIPVQNEIISSLTNESPVSEKIIVTPPSDLKISSSEKPSSGQQDNSVMNAVSEKENSNHEKFSAYDYVEPAPKQELNKIVESEKIAAALDQSNVQLFNENNKAAEKSESEEPEIENNSASTIPADLINNEPANDASLGIITNVITPNYDSENNIFIINGFHLKSLRVSISNISGKVIHQWNNLHGFWDGKLENGNDAEPGVYFYDIFAESKNGNPLVKKGSFHLIR